MIITLDGPAGTGKSTVAKELARVIGFTHIDTGAMYRSVTYAFMKHHIPLDDTISIKNLLDTFDLTLHREGDSLHYFLEGEEITQVIRSREVNDYVSDVAQLEEVRASMVSIQRKLAEGNNVVCEGRDLGTVVFPQAEMKIFLTARSEVCAKRRYIELYQKHGANLTTTEEMIKENLEKRNQLDSSRKISPLKQPEGAIVIDTSDLSITQVLETILLHYEQIKAPT
ncbi:MAG: cmk [Chlamydiales bacterium]|jgi:cytidylate kinase|nr:cmk [Chlamydiales bacterium]